MNTILAGSNHLAINFYSAFLDMLELEHEHFNSISIAMKRAAMNKDIINIFIVLETREDFLIYSKLKDSIDESSKNLVVIYMNDEIKKMATMPRLIMFSHRELTYDFAGTMAKLHICKPYMQEKSEKRSPAKVMEYIKFMLLKGKITLPIQNECAFNVLAALDQENITFKSIAQMTQTDPVLHSGIIKMANSVYFSGVFSNVNDVEKALIRVGLSNVKVFLINFINKSIAANKDLIFSEEINKCTQQSLKTASLAYVIAECFKVVAPVTMFSLGLLSLLGNIFIYAAISDYFSGEDFGESKPEEYLKLAETHGIKIGGMLLKKWKFSEDYYLPIMNAPDLEHNSHMNETRILYMAINFIDFFDTGKIDHKVRDVLSKCQLCLEEVHLNKMRNDAIEHHKQISSFL